MLGVTRDQRDQRDASRRAAVQCWPRRAVTIGRRCMLLRYRKTIIALNRLNWVAMVDLFKFSDDCTSPFAKPLT